MADLLEDQADQMRVLTGNVGGSFGMKGSPYPEYVRPVPCRASSSAGRSNGPTTARGSFLSDQHGRDHDFDGELALDKDGKFLAVRLTGYANVGGYLANVGPLMGSMGVTRNLAAIYRTPLIEVATKVALHQHLAGRRLSRRRAARGQLLHGAADRHGGARDGHRPASRCAAATTSGPRRCPTRRRRARPTTAASSPTLLDKALKLADVGGLRQRARPRARRAASCAACGIGDYLEVTAPPMKEMGGIRFEANGDVTIITGTLDYGQGHWSPFAQVLTEKLGIPFERIKLIQGDSDLLIAGGGTGGSKSIMASGAAIVEAADKVIDKGKQIAGVALEAAAADIEFSAGRFTIVGTDRGIGIMELAERLRGGMKLPEGVPATLDVSHVHEAAPSAFPNGCACRRGRDRSRHRLRSRS